MLLLRYSLSHTFQLFVAARLQCCAGAQSVSDRYNQKLCNEDIYAYIGHMDRTRTAFSASCAPHAAAETRGGKLLSRDWSNRRKKAGSCIRGRVFSRPPSVSSYLLPPEDATCLAVRVVCSILSDGLLPYVCKEPLCRHPQGHRQSHRIPLAGGHYARRQKSEDQAGCDAQLYPRPVFW
jgi:hypothetical protein